MSSYPEPYPSSSLTGASYSKTTLTATLTTVLTTESLYTSDGEEKTTTFQIATVLPPGTEIINESKPSPIPRKSNTVIIVGAALGGFIGIVVICLIVCALTRRRRRKRPQRIPPSPSLGYASPVPPASITPFGYQSPERAQPHHEPLFLNEGSNVVLYPPQVMDEKRKRNLLQRPNGHQSRPSQTSVDDGGSSIRSQPQTTSSGFSSAPGTQHAAQPVRKNRHPDQQHQHQRSQSANSETSLVAQSDRRSSMMSTGPAHSASRVPVSTPMGPVQEEAPQFALSPNQGFHQPSYVSSSGSGHVPTMGGPPTNHYPHPQHRAPYHYPMAATGPVYPAPGASSSAAGNSRDANAIGATVDRADGAAAQVFAAKNSNMRNDRRGGEDDVEENLTNLSELPPTYDSLQHRGSRMGSG